jgi:fructose-bisphosphate aldolase class 1
VVQRERDVAIVHQMRTRIITSPSLTGDRILSAILFENTMDMNIEGQPTADRVAPTNTREADEVRLVG